MILALKASFTSPLLVPLVALSPRKRRPWTCLSPLPWGCLFLLSHCVAPSPLDPTDNGKPLDALRRTSAAPPRLLRLEAHVTFESCSGHLRNLMFTSRKLPTMTTQTSTLAVSVQSLERREFPTHDQACSFPFRIRGRLLSQYSNGTNKSCL